MKDFQKNQERQEKILMPFQILMMKDKSMQQFISMSNISKKTLNLMLHFVSFYSFINVQITQDLTLICMGNCFCIAMLHQKLIMLDGTLKTEKLLVNKVMSIHLQKNILTRHMHGYMKIFTKMNHLIILLIKIRSISRMVKLS